MGNDPIKKPEIIVFAGPNGSGKSTITDLLRPPMVPYINADEIQRVLGCDNMEAAKIAEKRREDYLTSLAKNSPTSIGGEMNWLVYPSDIHLTGMV